MKKYIENLFIVKYFARNWSALSWFQKKSTATAQILGHHNFDKLAKK